MKACGSCRFFQQFNGSESGTCRRTPPVRTPEHSGTWPQVRSADWCGEFRSLPYRSAEPSPQDELEAEAERRAR